MLATPLLMADVASAIAQGGRRPKPTLLKGAGGVADRATTPETARFIARAMRSVVTDGTGIGAAVPGVKVAGKTGTAELRSTVSEDPIPDDPTQPPPEEDLTDTDAWFTAFAPLKDPQVAVCVLLVGQGAGGATAAPAAKTVIEAALKNDSHSRSRARRHRSRRRRPTPRRRRAYTSRSTTPVVPRPA